MASECYAIFVLTGADLNPMDVTAKTGVTPTKTWLKGELISPPKATIRHQFNGWTLRSPTKYVDFNDADDLAEHIKIVLEQLQVGWLAFVEICAEYHAEFCCVVYTRGERPAIHFDRTILNQLSELNAELGVDLYVLPEEEAQN